MNAYVTFSLDDMRIGLPLDCVERTERAVLITPLPSAPEIVLGVVNVRGRVLPVIDVRRRFRLPSRALGHGDRMIVADSGRRSVVLLADAVGGVVECAEDAIFGADAVAPGLDFVKGVVKRDDGLILIHDLARFLSLEEDAQLARALAAETSEAMP